MASRDDPAPIRLEPHRAVIINGGPGHFAAGAGAKEMPGLGRGPFGARNSVLRGAFHALATAPQVTIAGCAASSARGRGRQPSPAVDEPAAL
jgi:hypothetical protein